MDQKQTWGEKQKATDGGTDVCKCGVDLWRSVRFRVVAAGGIWSFGSSGSSEDHLHACKQCVCVSVWACMDMYVYTSACMC